MENSDFFQSLEVELLRIRQMANQADVPLLVYFIEMAIQQLKSNSCITADDAGAAGGEQRNRIQSSPD